MSRVLADAEADGLLARTQDPKDRRRTLVELTNDGQSLVRDGQMLRVWFMARVLSDWDPADVEQLTSYFERAVATFEDRFDVVRQESEALLGYDLLPTPTEGGN
jgi:DNA-binding MarR family transcriptional regulator